MNQDQPFRKRVEQVRKPLDQSTSDQSRKRRSLREVAAMLSSSDLAELIVGARFLRKRHLGSELFGKPAWDILLQLHIAHYRDNAISVTAAITFGDTPPSTGLRWLSLLEQEGLVERHPDPADNRRQFVCLSREGVAKMEAYTEPFTQWVISRASIMGDSWSAINRCRAVE